MSVSTGIRRPFIVVFILMVCGMTAALAQDSQQASGFADEKPYTVNPGDQLGIVVWKEEDLQRTVIVRPDGAFSFPLVADVRAEGKTVEEIRRELEEKLARYIPDLVVTVSTEAISGNKIYVIGQVQRPGEFVVNTRVDVTQALSIAGGMTPFAQNNDIKILRRQDGRLLALGFRYGDIEAGKRLDQNIILEPGDIVVVP